MKARRKSIETLGGRTKRRIHELEGAAGGAIVGAVAGAIGGPAGVVAGAILGGIAGAATEAVIESEVHRVDARTRVLDEESGVSGGDLRAPNLQHPPPTSGAYSASPSNDPVPTIILRVKP